MEINLRTIKRAVSLVYNILQAHVLQRLFKSVGSHLPILVRSHGIFRSCGQLHKIFKSKLSVNFIDQLCYALDLILNLVIPHENMSIILCKAAHPHQTVKLSALLMAVNQTQFAHAQGQVTVGMRLVLIYQHTARTVHWLNRVILLIDHRGIHVILVMIPVAGILPQLTAQDNGSGNLLVPVPVVNLTPVINQGIL